jgi:hypothetical protein
MEMNEYEIFVCESTGLKYMNDVIGVKKAAELIKDAMSYKGLKKITHYAMVLDSTLDLDRITKWRESKGMNPIVPKTQSLRQIENAVALSVKDLDTSDAPILERGVNFYISIIPEL